MMPRIDPRAETLRILGHLRKIVEESGVGNEALEQELGFRGGELAKVLSGEVALEFQHLIDILKALGTSRAQFFAELYSQRPRPGGDRS